MTFVSALLAAWKLLRRTPPQVVWAVVLLGALFVLKARYVGNIRDAEARGRAGALRDAKALYDSASAKSAALQHTVDSLTTVAAQQGEALDASVARVRLLLVNRSLTASSPALPDGVGSAATTVPVAVPWAFPTSAQPFGDTSLVRACTALANDCEEYRRSARQTIDVATQQTKAERSANVALSFQLVAAKDDLAGARASFASQAKWRNVERGVCAGAVAASLLWGVTK